MYELHIMKSFYRFCASHQSPSQHAEMPHASRDPMRSVHATQFKMLFWTVILDPVQSALMSVKTFPHHPDVILLMDMLVEAQQQRRGGTIPSDGAASLAHAHSGLDAARDFWIDAVGGPAVDPLDGDDLGSFDDLGSLDELSSLDSGAGAGDARQTQLRATDQDWAALT